MNFLEHVAELGSRFNVRLDIYPCMSFEDSGAGCVVVTCPACARKNVLRRPGMIRCGACKHDLGRHTQVHCIMIPLVTDERSYAAALHELGHCLHPTGRVNDSHGSRTMRTLHQIATIADMRYELLEEQSAWEWAQAHARVWTPVMEECKRSALNTYYQFASRLGLLPDGRERWRVRK